ncbi:MAG: gliding motility-associated C-terminal domain-containing protein, partial [Flavobacteriales bacterium]|nr:gliding motility-associated C-terminal domain-containing protein [Flavobacteriales bacterium]
GTNGTLTVCETGGAVALFASLGGTPQVGGTWNPAAPGGMYDPATMAPGVYTYTVLGTSPCANATATVTVTETGSPNAGTDGTITVCENGAAIDLFAQLGGSPDAGGTWSPAAPGGMYDPTTMAPGAYVYTLNALAPCADASSTVMVAEAQQLDAGEDASLQLCSGAATQDLFALLGPDADADGVWTGPAGPFGGMFDPGSDASGTYTYAFPAGACPAASASVVVAVEEGPDAGGDGAITLCSTNASISLFSLLTGTPDATGSWTNAAGVPVPVMFDPLTASGGVFTYSVAASGNCPADRASVTVSVNVAPVAGTSGSLALCGAGSPVSLFDGLGGTLDAGGTWTAPDNSTHATVVDPAVDASGVYTYTVVGTAPCVDAVSTVAVFIAPVPDAGGDASTVQCSSGATFVMTGMLAGTPQADGIWRGPGGDVVSAAFSPATGQAGVYTYTVQAMAPCTDDVARLTIAISPASDAGLDASVSICENSDDAIGLFTLLGGTPDPDGAWYMADGTPFDGTFIPGTTPAGAYTYAVHAPAPCAAATATVVVDVVPMPVADFIVEGAGACTPVTVTLTNTWQGGASCAWLLWNGEQVEDCAPVTRTITEGGTYGATLIVDAGNGCGTDTLAVPDLFTVYDQPTADFQHVPQAVNTLAPDVRFNNTSENAIGYLWDIAGLTTTTETGPVYTFPVGEGAEYLVCLTAFASEACRDTICKVITVEDGLLIHVPNAFTPDGVAPNDIFKPVIIGVDPANYRFYIFDRWGQPLYETSDPDAGWNGLFTNGTEVPIGVYVWKLVAKDKITANRIERVGHVTLVR